jgi:PilZ domain-containing protein
MGMRQAAVDRRRSDRERRRISVRYGNEEARHLGYTQEADEQGMFLQGNQLYPPGTVLNLELDTPEGIIEAKGVVRWVKQVPAAFRRSMRGGMGIEILS